MHFSVATAAAIVALLPSSALAVGGAYVQNKCSFPVYLWSVGSSVGPKQVLAPNSGYGEPLHRDPTTGGIAIKLTTVDDGLYLPNVPQTVFSYSLDNALVWYDLSDVFGDAFAGHPLQIKTNDDTCGAISWPNGVPAGSHPTPCSSNANVVFTLCA